MTDNLDTDTARIVAALADLNAQIAELNERAEALKAELRTLPAGDYAINGTPALRIVAARRFDASRALELVPEELRPACYTSTVDPAKVKEYLAPALVETVMVPNGKPRVVVL